ncbi:MAG TPA: trypsin-like peptidase domain-containing protein [Mycobacteriales bacterium]|nr:trypsin-like peptidase domain-containing protein [Mycobacteriales bacterium]
MARAIALGAVGSLTLAGCGAAASGASSAKSSTAPASGTTTAAVSASAGSPAAVLQQNYVNVIHRVLPSVVEITTGRDLGSGIVFDSRGDIVTNDHVVGAATHFQVRLSTGGPALAATLVGTYPPDDLAVIHVTNAKGLHPATFADSTKTAVGDIVLAMGNPLGLASSVTNGIISATGRTVSEPRGAGSPGATIAGAVQTSASINPGNSGGALVGLDGKVVGIPTLAAVDPQLGGTAAGIGFAIPSNTVTDIAGQIVKNGHVINSHRAALGVRVGDVTDPNGTPIGAGIAQLTAGGPAAKAGLKPGDVIVAVNNTSVTGSAELAKVLAQFQPGDKVTIKVVDGTGASRLVTATLGQLPG